jgi:hypothetical protein
MFSSMRHFEHQKVKSPSKKNNFGNSPLVPFLGHNIQLKIANRHAL